MDKPGLDLKQITREEASTVLPYATTYGIAFCRRGRFEDAQGPLVIEDAQVRLRWFPMLRLLHSQIMEECGFDVPLDRIHPVTSYLSGKP